LATPSQSFDEDRKRNETVTLSGQVTDGDAVSTEQNTRFFGTAPLTFPDIGVSGGRDDDGHGGGEDDRQSGGATAINDG
jgi:hypothetical protein